MPGIRVTGIERAFAQLEGGVETFINNEIATRNAEAFGNAVLATPVDTGNARSSWRQNQQLTLVGRYEIVTPVVENTTDYIQVLNGGSSRQAPTNFIETAYMNAGFTDVNVEVIPGEL